MFSTPQSINELLAEELSLTTTALKANPKVYWLWNHRRWCLQNVPDGPDSGDGSLSQGWKTQNWERELYVVERMLDADPRNCTKMQNRTRSLSVCLQSKTTIIYSSCVELSTIRAGEYARQKTGYSRVGIHDTKDRGQFLQLQCMAPAIKGSISVVE